MESYFERYLNGDCSRVWSDLSSIDPSVLDHENAEDVSHVVTETMGRVRKNLSIIYSELQMIGYEFGLYPDRVTRVYGYSSPITPPPADITDLILNYEKRDGIQSFPLSIKKFWEVVGSVDFIGYHPKLPKFSDPIVVYPVDVIQYGYSAWVDHQATDRLTEQKFSFPLSPDSFHKDNISGGEPYQMELPNHGVDGRVRWLDDELYFVDYLRTCIKNHGFYGLRLHQDDLPPEIMSVGKDCLDF
jgi:hypothetical protein